MFNFLRSPSLSYYPGILTHHWTSGALGTTFLGLRLRVTDHKKPVSLCSTLPLPQPLLYSTAEIQPGHSRRQENNTSDQAREALALKNCRPLFIYIWKVFRMCVGMNVKDPHQNGRNITIVWTEFINMDEFTKDACFCVFADMGNNRLYNWLMYTHSVLTLIKWNKIPEIRWPTVDEGIGIGGI